MWCQSEHGGLSRHYICHQLSHVGKFAERPKHLGMDSKNTRFIQFVKEVLL
jgi:hypothetical protein